jgi:aerobic carbon-monoxide dehydrogenase medium subunit
MRVPGRALLPPLHIHAPATTAEAVTLLEELGPAARPYAGGTALLLAREHRGLGHLVDLKGIPGLAEVSGDGGTLRIGAAATFRSLARHPSVRERLPELVELIEHIANPRVIAAATLGGNLAFAEPRTDPATLLTALDATLAVAGPGAEPRTMVSNLWAGAQSTTLDHGHLLTTVEVALPPQPYAVSYQRYAPVGWPSANVAVVLREGPGGFARAALAVGAACPTPRRLGSAEEALSAVTLDGLPGLAAGIAADAAAGLDAVDDDQGSAEYKRHLTAVLAERALLRAASRLRSDEEAR